MTISVTSDRTRMDVAMIHAFLSQSSYWAKNIPRDVVERAIEHSICFGAFESDRQVALDGDRQVAFDDDQQVGFARVITDYATFAYLADVFVLPSRRGRGIGKQIMEAIAQHPDLHGLRRWHLVTRDAHALYAQFGFEPIDAPERHMMKVVRNAYG